MKNLLLRCLLKFKIKIFDVSLEFLIEVSTQKIKFNLYNDQIYIANLKRFSNQSSHSTSDLSFSKSSLPLLSLFVCMKHLFIRSALFQSYLYLLGNSGIRAYKVHLKRLRGQSKIQDTQRLLGHSEGTWALGHLVTRRALGHLEHSGT